ncbi:GMC family oxidoreductase N-terminal domain-containing protein [Methylobacterium sp. E-005]|uniref:GMC family oxidoreductase n=1 Tax=Methylobacterium sp. E-005 TaxID=2836549 RepID=UPI001FB90B7C|nr:GMC family oxidoreductase N-terminal domain-containing protein [Methylobacterium sp. E-005]MCJ2088466.1 GMC family oxidoreductase N-terminal domain-containing protein [Methylobacterium sp. E-005]
MTHAASPSDAETFDYVIVGAGAAGAVLANRLSTNPRVSVCLLEAGSPDTSPWLRIPAGFIKVVYDPAWTWQFSAEPTELTAGRRIALPQGRTLGGTTSINGMIYNRGQAADYDEWAAQGCPGWSYREVLPYFRRSQRWLGPTDDDYHGRTGELPVSHLAWHHPICEAFIAGAVAAGLPRNRDYNGADQAGVGYFQRTIGGRWRSSTARAFLRPIRARANLAIRTRAQTTQVLFDGPRATGVRYMQGDGQHTRTVLARREVVLCCGTLNTPRLLELSGIGHPSRLSALGIELRHALPGVGENLADHFSVRVVARVANARTINELSRGVGLAGQIARWIIGRPSLLSVSPSLVHWFARSSSEVARPDLQGVFTPASYREGAIGVLDDYPGMTAGVWAHRPKSRGSIHLRSADPREPPLIQANYLSHPEDRHTLVRGIRMARNLLRMPELARYFQSESLPGSEIDDDDALLSFAKRYGVSAQHLVGTARMGSPDDTGAVVGPDLKVHGLSGLRVADASVMPATPSGNTCAATMMIGEKGADLLLATPGG